MSESVVSERPAEDVNHVRAVTESAWMWITFANVSDGANVIRFTGYADNLQVKEQSAQYRVRYILYKAVCM